MKSDYELGGKGTASRGVHSSRLESYVKGGRRGERKDFCGKDIKKITPPGKVKQTSGGDD